MMIRTVCVMISLMMSQQAQAAPEPIIPTKQMVTDVRCSIATLSLLNLHSIDGMDRFKTWSDQQTKMLQDLAQVFTNESRREQIKISNTVLTVLTSVQTIDRYLAFVSGDDKTFAKGYNEFYKIMDNMALQDRLHREVEYTQCDSKFKPW